MIYDKQTVFEFWAEMIEDLGLDFPSQIELIYKALKAFHPDLDDESKIFYEVREELSDWLDEYLNP